MMITIMGYGSGIAIATIEVSAIQYMCLDAAAKKLNALKEAR